MCGHRGVCQNTYCRYMVSLPTTTKKSPVAAMSADGAERSMNTSPVPPPTFPLSLPPTPSSPRHSMHSLPCLCLSISISPWTAKKSRQGAWWTTESPAVMLTPPLSPSIRPLSSLLPWQPWLQIYLLSSSFTSWLCFDSDLFGFALMTVNVGLVTSY